jgi:cytoskeletal protein CcmA (bactofilin family)
MFSSKNKEKDTTAMTVPAAQSAMTPKRMTRSSAAPSIISADLTVNGTLSSTGDIQIDGRVEGDVHSAGLVIGDKAFIHGDVVAEEVTVRGRVQGGIRARKVLLASTCHVEGNILHEAFAVETGAFFEGNCRHADNPLADEGPKKTTDYRSSTSPVVPPPSATANGSGAVPRPMTAPAATAATFTPLKTN